MGDVFTSPSRHILIKKIIFNKKVISALFNKKLISDVTLEIIIIIFLLKSDGWDGKSPPQIIFLF